MDRHQNGVRILFLQIICDRIDIISNNTGGTGSIDKGKLRMITFHCLFHCLAKFLFAAKHDAFLIHI